MLKEAMNLASKGLIFTGVVLILIGVIYHFGEKFLPLGRLPGDFSFERQNVKIYFPFATSILLSLALSLIVWIVRWLSNKN